MEKNLAKEAILSKTVFTAETVTVSVGAVFAATLCNLTTLDFLDSVMLVGQRMIIPAMLLGISIAKLEYDHLSWESHKKQSK